MAVEKISFGASVVANSQQFSNNNVSNNAQVIKGHGVDSVEISSKKGKKELSNGKKLLCFVGVSLMAGLIGAFTHKFITTRPSFVKKEMSKNLGRPLTNNEIAEVEKNCKKSYTGWNFFDDIITTII